MASEIESFTIGCMRHCRLIIHITRHETASLPHTSAAMTELKPKYKCNCTCEIILCKPAIDISHNSHNLGPRRQNPLYGMLHYLPIILLSNAQKVTHYPHDYYNYAAVYTFYYFH